MVLRKINKFIKLISSLISVILLMHVKDFPNRSDKPKAKLELYLFNRVYFL